MKIPVLAIAAAVGYVMGFCAAWFVEGWRTAVRPWAPPGSPNLKLECIHVGCERPAAHSSNYCLSHGPHMRKP